MVRWSEEELEAKLTQRQAGKLSPPRKQGPQRKYRNVPTEVDGITFDSGHEADRYRDLRLLERGGEISDLRLQVRFALTVGRVHICDYIADFVYIDKAGKEVVEDAKGVRTAVYVIKRKLMAAIHGIAIQEV